MTWAWQSPVPTPHDHPPHPMASLLARLESVLLPLLFRLDLLARHLPAIRALHLPLARTRLARAHARIASILRALTEGTWRAPRPQVPRPGTPRPNSARAPYLPRRREFLLRATADAEVITAASQLNALLREPGTQHLLAQAPATARAAIAKALRGPAHLLGLELPNLLLFPGPPRPPRPRRNRPSPRTRGGSTEGGVAANAPARGLLPTDLPIPRNVLAFTRHNRRRFGKGA
jgi:hypothetical protein